MRAARPAWRSSLGLSAGLHAVLALAAWSLHSASPGGPARKGREYRLEVAREEPLERPPEAPEPEVDLRPTEELEPPELVPQEVVPEEPPPELQRPELDDSFELTDPLERVTETRWPDRSRPEPVAPPKPVEAAPPPIPTPEPSHAPREHVPVVLEGPAPAYPRAAQRLGLQGSVKLRALVARDGRVREVILVESSGHSLLDDAAREKLAEWLFRPWQTGEPEERSYLKTFTFRLPR